MAKEKVHTLTIKIRFDKAITKTQAKAEFRDSIYGIFYPGFYSDAETMRIINVKS